MDAVTGLLAGRYLSVDPHAGRRGAGEAASHWMPRLDANSERGRVAEGPERSADSCR